MTVTVEKLNPRVGVITKRTLELVGSGVEKTAARFTLDANGEVVSTSEIDRSILQTFVDASRNGGSQRRCKVTLFC